MEKCGGKGAIQSYLMVTIKSPEIAFGIFQAWKLYLAFGRVNSVSENISQYLNICGKKFSLTHFHLFPPASQDFCKLKRFDIISGKLYTRKEGMLNGTRENYR